MKSLRILSISAVCALCALSVRASEPGSLDPHLEPLRPLLDKTWKGEFKGSTPEKPVVDVSRWERALNGHAVRMTHSINDGVYGGESVFFWDEQKQAVVYHYFTTAGFRSEGTLELKHGRFETHETILGNAGGIAQVRSVAEITPEGSFHVKSEHLKSSEWSPGHEVTYHEAPSAKVNFK